MKHTLITTFHQAGMEQYGQRMIDTFEQHWPDEVDLVVYTENCQPTKTKSNVRFVDTLAVNPNLVEFLERHKNNPLAHGQAGPPEVYQPNKQFRWDAVRFCWKPFAEKHAANNIDTDWLTWCDADTLTHTPIDVEFFRQAYPGNEYMLTYLGRGDRYHPECGWKGYNMRHPNTKMFINEFVAQYEQDKIFDLTEWHDSYVWGELLKRYREDNKVYNLNPKPDLKGFAGHPFINSVIGRYMDHVKGKRKEDGHSTARDIQTHEDHPYWNTVRSKA